MKSRLCSLYAIGLVLILGGAAAAATVAQATAPIDGSGTRSGESALGDLVADAVRSAAGTDIAMVPAGVLNEVNIPAGAVTDEVLTSVLAFPDENLSVLSLTGRDIRQALERSLEVYPKGNSGFLQVSGLTVRFNPGASGGSRVTSVQVGGAALEPGRAYQVAMPISLGRGGLGYFRIWDKGDMARTIDTKMSAALIDYAQSQGRLAYTAGSRIVPAK